MGLSAKSQSLSSALRHERNCMNYEEHELFQTLSYHTPKFVMPARTRALLFSIARITEVTTTNSSVLAHKEQEQHSPSYKVN